jgi:SEC-C motif-containing protein
MRARYTAYVRENLEFIATTFAPESRKDFDAPAARRWAAQADWLGLKLLSTEKGLPEDTTGMVEFAATYKQNGATFEHRERSQFRKSDTGQWLFVVGDTQTSRLGEPRRLQNPGEKPQTVVRDAPKVGRNDPCPCGSGKKYKKCCAALGG